MGLQEVVAQGPSDLRVGDAAIGERGLAVPGATASTVSSTAAILARSASASLSGSGFVSNTWSPAPAVRRSRRAFVSAAPSTTTASTPD